MTKTIRVPPPGAIPFVPRITFEKQDLAWILSSTGISAGDELLPHLGVDLELLTDRWLMQRLADERGTRPRELGRWATAVTRKAQSLAREIRQATSATRIKTKALQLLELLGLETGIGDPRHQTQEWRMSDAAVHLNDRSIGIVVPPSFIQAVRAAAMVNRTSRETLHLHTEAIEGLSAAAAGLASRMQASVRPGRPTMMADRIFVVELLQIFAVISRTRPAVSRAVKSLGEPTGPTTRWLEAIWHHVTTQLPPGLFGKSIEPFGKSAEALGHRIRRLRAIERLPSVTRAPAGS